MSLESSAAQHNSNTSSLDPLGPHVATSCFDLLLIELVPLSYRLVAHAADRELELNTQQRRRLKESVDLGSTASTVSKSVAVKDGAQHLGIGGIGGRARGMDDEETRERVFWRLDTLGYRVGLGLVERFSKDKPRFTDALDAIKFLCKDLWLLVFKKQIDNLKTNHRGVYVLTDNSFKPLSKISLERGREGMMAQAQPFLYFPAGLIRGALASMGIVATVQPECIELPGATFQIRTSSATP